jgi:hypothetical protein
VDDGDQSRIVAALSALDKQIEELGGEVRQQVRAFADAALGVEVVEDVVGLAGEAVQRVHSRPVLGRKQAGRQIERLAVL